MLLSMTGYGEAVSRASGLAVSAEIRTINARHFKLSFRASDGYAGLEPNAERLVRQRIRRGSVQLSLRVEAQSPADSFRINGDVLRGYLDQLQSVAGQSPTAEPVRVEALLALPGVVTEQRAIDFDPAAHWQAIEPVVSEALDSAMSMRAQEGAALAQDLHENCRQITGHLEAIEARSPSVVEEYRQRLADRVNKALAELNVTVQPSDLIREVAILLDRSDISEEVVRLRCHIEQFVAALDLPESAGRKLEFIAQEMGREINTIGSKANDARISEHVVDVKAALERIREQVQNVE